MAVLAEALSVVIKDSSLRTKFIGGTKEFLKTIPNNTYCSDGELHRIGFMRPQDTEAYISNLERNGLIFIYGNHCIDIVVVDMLKGPTMQCKWLGFARQKFFSGSGQFIHSEEDFSIVWLLHRSSKSTIPVNQKKECTISVPSRWTPDKAIYGNNFIPSDKVDDSLIEVEDDKGVIKYIFAATGEFVYVGKPKIKFSDNSDRN
jgi:hypothetical protein